MGFTRRLDNFVAVVIARIRRALVPRKKFRTGSHFCGQCYLPNLDNTAEVLAAAEGEWFK